MNQLKVLCLMFVLAALGTGCGSVQKQLTAITVLEHSSMGYVQNLKTIADEAVALLPEDQRAAKRAQITELSDSITQACAKKDIAMQDASAANSLAGIDFGKLTQDVIAAIQAFIALVDVIGNDVAASKAVAGAPTNVVERLRKSTKEANDTLVLQQARVKAALAQ